MDMERNMTDYFKIIFERLKKICQYNEKKSEEVMEFVENDDIIKMDIAINNMFDTEIASLIYEMNRVGIRTGCSCQGHNREDAYISICLDKDITYKYRKDGFGIGRDELIIRWKIKRN